MSYRISKGEGRRKRKVVVHHNRLKPYIQRSEMLVDQHEVIHLEDQLDVGNGEKKHEDKPKETAFHRDLNLLDSKDDLEPEARPEPGRQIQPPSTPRRAELRKRENIVPPQR